MLSDRTIRRLLNKGDLRIWSDGHTIQDIQIQPASFELRLGNDFVNRSRLGDVPIQCEDGEPLEVYPGMCLLATTWETVRLPDNMIAVVDGKSTWGRGFLIIHSTAGYIDPGFEGEVTLEISNVGNQVITIKPGDRICQLRFSWLDCPALRPYGHPDLRNHYLGQQGPTLPHGEDLS